MFSKIPSTEVKFFQSDDPALFKLKALHWANQFRTTCFLDANNHNDPYAAFDALIAADSKYELKVSSGNAFDQLDHFLKSHPDDFIPGYFSYDLKNEIEALESKNYDGLKFPDLYFFVPRYLIKINGSTLEIHANDADAVYNVIQKIKLPIDKEIGFEGQLKNRFTYAEYEHTFEEFKKHIYRGDIYEVNFCQEFFATHIAINPINAFIELNRSSPTPFATFFKHNHHYILSASPERFVCKRGNKLISQPIKGTSRRNSNQKKDEQAKHDLRNNLKELTENVMIVDLVRNDMTKNAAKGSVKVEELFGIYSFKQVHQMISTVVCQLAQHVSKIDAIRNMYPMGSMTGAPKIKAMQLIEQYERTKRGVYSGSVGYFSPNGNFDFNVVIRTLLYNAKNKYLSFQVGSAITLDANAKQEYEECMIKAQAIIQLLLA